MKYKKIAFIGMMGSGKSTIAHELSLKTDTAVFDCDSLFEEKYNISISDFFKKYSQEKFRICETEILKEAIKLPKFILSTGGGVILSETNREILFKGDIYTIYLSASPETIYNRIKNDDKRPLLKVENPLDEIKKIIKTREKYYKLANKEIITDNKTTDEIIKELQWIL